MAQLQWNADRADRIFTFGSSTAANNARLETVSVVESNEYGADGTVLLGKILTFSVKALMVGSTAADLAARIKYARHSLNESKVQVIVALDTTNTYSYTPGFIQFDPPAGQDQILTATCSRNTPKPKKLTFPAFIGDTTTRVEFEFEVFVAWQGDETYADNRRGQAATFDAGISKLIYDVRWSFDDNFIPSITYSGAIEVLDSYSRSDIIDFINKKFPVTRSWKRESCDIQWTEESNDLPAGHTVSFTLQDAYKKRTIPTPATTGEAKIRLESNQSRTIKNLSGYFAAPHDVDNRELLALAFDILTKRMDIFGLDGRQTGADFLTNVSIGFDLFSSRVEFAYEAKVLGKLIDLEQVATLLSEDVREGMAVNRLPSSLDRGKPFGDKNGEAAVELNLPNEATKGYIYFSEVLTTRENSGAVVADETKEAEGGAVAEFKLAMKRRAYKANGGKVHVIRTGVMARAGQACEAPPVANALFQLSTQNNNDPDFAYIGGQVMVHGWRPGAIKGSSIHIMSYVYVYESLKVSSIENVKRWEASRNIAYDYSDQENVSGAVRPPGLDFVEPTTGPGGN